MTEQQQEFFDMVKADDVYGLTTMINQQPDIVNAVNEHGVGGVLVALYQGRKDVAQLLVVSGAKVDTCTAAALGDMKRLERAMARESDAVTKFAGDGWTALHLAVYFGQKDAAKVLLDAGAAVNARSDNALNNHPLHAAAAGGSRDCVALLLEHGAEVNATQAGGFTALHAAAKNGDPEMVKALLVHGANTDMRADNGQTALDLAMQKGSQPTVDLLTSAPGIQ